jgi:CRP-like cAMP-binding protein
MIEIVGNQPSELLETFLQSIEQGKSVVRLKRNAALYYQGDIADAAFFLQSGRMKLVVVSFGGKQATLSVLRPKELFGLGAGEDASHIATATALEPATVLRVEYPPFISALRANPRIYELVLASLANQYLHLQKHLCAQLLDQSQQRLARTLIALNHPTKGPYSGRLPPQISHRVLASMIGTTRSRVTFFINQFRSRGLVAPGKRTVVHGSKLREALHSGLLDGVLPE